MKKISTFLMVCLLVSVAQAGIIDNFDDGTMLEYTQTVILETTDPGATYDTVFSNASFAVQADLGVYPGIEQAMALREDYSLAVGEELKIDATGYGSGLSQDLGIAVAATKNPTPGGPRSDYYISFVRGDGGHPCVSGFDGESGLTLAQAQGLPAIQALYIERISATSFEAGYYDSLGVKTLLGSHTFANSAIGTAIGLYSDMRAVGTVGTLDNLEIIPEPATIALLGLGGLLLRRKRS